MISFAGEKMRVRFDRFDLDAYSLFLKSKRLPEADIVFDEKDESYTVEAPARFAALLGIEPPSVAVTDLPLSSFLFDDQQAITTMALEAKRFAVWSGCGQGKSLIEFEFARHVIHKTKGRVLLISLNEIVKQLVEECQRFYGDSMTITRLNSREEMKRWCISGPPAAFARGRTRYLACAGQSESSATWAILATIQADARMQATLRCILSVWMEK